MVVELLMSERTKEIKLKRLKESDAKNIFELVDERRESLDEFFSWTDSTNTIEDTKRFIVFEEGRTFQFGIYFQKILVGVLGVNDIDKYNKHCTIGYWIGTKYQNKGFCTKAVEQIVHWIFTDLQLNRIEIRCAENNFKSQRIPKKLNFEYEGMLKEAEYIRNHFVNLKVYGLLKKNWQKKKT